MSVWIMWFFKSDKEAKKTEPSLSLDKDELSKKLYEAVYKDLLQEESASDARVKELILWHANELAKNYNLSLDKLLRLEEKLFNKLRRFDILQPLLEDKSISEIMVNGENLIFYERAGRIYKSDLAFKSKEELSNLIISFFSRHNAKLSLSTPMADLRLEDGSRLNAVIPPIAPDGPILTIRKFTGIRPDIKALIDSKFLSKDLALFLKDLVINKQAIMIGGGTSTGKTTLLNVLSAFIPPAERIVSIEDSPELQLQNKDNWVRLITREDKLNKNNNINMNDLIRNSLRMRPDRIIIGEVRGKEAYSMLQAMQTGHPGSLCTIHANDIHSMLTRLAILIYNASGLDYDLILKTIASSFDYLIYIKRDREGFRYLDELAKLDASTADLYQLESLYKYEKDH